MNCQNSSKAKISVVFDTLVKNTLSKLPANREPRSRNCVECLPIQNQETLQYIFLTQKLNSYIYDIKFVKYTIDK